MKTERCKDLGELLNVFPALLPGCTIPGAGPGQILQPLAEYIEPGAKSRQSQRDAKSQSNQELLSDIWGQGCSTSLPGLADVLMKSLAGGTTAQR